MRFISDFEELSKKDVDIAGGKGASLGEMTQAGIPVPPGFVVLSTTFDKFLASTDLNVEIEAALDEVNHKEIHTVENASEKIQALILGSEMPKDIADDIKKYFKKLGAQYVAVRSSATAEDSASAAWAGQLDSFLNTTEEYLLENVQKCWASLFTPRAIFYRFEKDLHKQKISVAVVVQKMVESEVSGIAFSVHPVTQDRNQLIIEAGFGLGEAIVSGSITPDSYVAEKNPYRIIDINVNEQTRGLYRVDGGGPSTSSGEPNEWRDISSEKAKSQVLSENEIKELAQIIIGIENHYGFPVDIEWAREKGKFYIVQSRPITTLSSHRDEKKQVKDYTLEKSLELMKTKRYWYNKSYSGYLFGLAQQGLAIAHGEKVSPYAIPYGLFFQNHNRLDHFDWFWDSELLVEKREQILDVARADQTFASQFNNTWRKEWDEYLAYWKTLAHVDFNDLPVDLIRKKLTPLHEKLVNHARYAYIVDTFLNDSEEDWLEQIIKTELVSKATPEVMAVLTAPTHESFVNEFETRKLEIAQQIVEGKTEKSVLVKCEALTQDFFWIRVNYHSYRRISVENIYREASEEAEKFGDKIAQKIKEEKNRISDNIKKKSVLIKKLKISQDLARIIEIVEIFTHIQDKRKESVLRSNVIFYDALSVTAKKLNIDSQLIFYLTPLEFLSKEKFEKINWDEIRDRRERGVLLVFCNEDIYLIPRVQYEKELPIHNFFKSLSDIKVIRGSIAYKGFVKGIARVVRNISEIKSFNDGEVLIANQTTPEYVPAMKKAIAFVTDQGGITCHAAIIAREMKKPCIIGTKIATQVLQDGDLVEVDADNGVVRILQSEPITTLTREDQNDVDNATHEVIKKLQSMQWERWLERPFNAFILSLFEDSSTHESFEEIGISNVELSAQLFQKSFWYINEAAFERMDKEVENYLATRAMIDVTNRLAKFKKVSQKKIETAIKNKADPEAKFTVVFEILKHCCTFIWLAHGIETYYQRKLKEKVPKYVHGDIDKFIGDASFPKKKNAHALLEEAIRDNLSAKEIVKKFGWLKTRDGFSDEFNIAEIEKMRKELTPVKAHPKVVIPKPLQALFDEIQELVFFRTARTDVFFELFFLSRPILKELAKKHGLEFGDLRYYRAKSLTRGKLEKYSPHVAFAYLDGAVVFQDEPIVRDVQISGHEMVRGTIAFKGKIQGVVRIVKTVAEISKVKKGDILVTQMTFPSFIPAMIRASAFVTDEGGITCHAAIVAREMQKPCIIGTKSATQVLKDGDLVEVDADNGVVRILQSGPIMTSLNLSGSEDSHDNFSLVENKNRDAFISELKNIDWIYWLNRPYSVFMATIFWEGLRENYFDRFGLKGLATNNHLYQFPDIYYDKQFLEKGLVFFENYFRSHKMADLSDALGTIHKHHIQELKKIVGDNTKTIPQKTAAMSDLVKDYIPSLWIIIQLEEHFNKRIAREVPKYIKGDYTKFVGDICVPKKKNVYILMQDEIKSGASIKHIQEKYGWLKSRDGFTDFYTEKEIEDITGGLKDVESHEVDIPKDLLGLAEELQELNFFRTDRTDKFYEFFGVARPLMIEIAKYIGVDFKELADYDAISIILDKPKKYKKTFSYGLIDNKYLISNEILISDFKQHETGEIKGKTAFKGIVRGIAKIVTHSNDIGKVKEGEVLVAQMTFPSFISAMQKAIAFVTDEGGITCHAAIIAREMKKPCIIGTKNATKLIKDGDLIEVDARITVL